jgi:hypothetical protein
MSAEYLHHAMTVACNCKSARDHNLHDVSAHWYTSGGEYHDWLLVHRQTTEIGGIIKKYFTVEDNNGILLLKCIVVAIAGGI